MPCCSNSANIYFYELYSFFYQKWPPLMMLDLKHYLLFPYTALAAIQLLGRHCTIVDFTRGNELGL